MTIAAPAAACPLQAAAAPPPPPPPKQVTVKYNVFFDGTGNNMYNVARREEVEAWKAGKWFGPLRERQEKRLDKRNSSYQNEISNVVRLYRAAPVHSTTSMEGSLYVEGIGTSKDEEDSGPGQALGMDFFMSSTGVTSRVAWAIEQVRDKVGGLVTDRRVHLTVELRVFGFSRGAAAARHFVHRALNGSLATAKLATQLQAIFGFTKVELSVSFAGLFDTVASLGLYHGNDVRELDLDAVRHVTGRVVHLAAADEFRDNFSLTNINSAKNRVEVFLPGAHSDIGGGYRDSADEIDLPVLELPWNPQHLARLSSGSAAMYAGVSGNDDPVAAQRTEWNKRLTEEQQWLVAQGWCTTTAQCLPKQNSLFVTRRNLRYHYQFIPLHIMADFSRESAVAIDEGLEEDTPVGTELANLRTPEGKSVEDHLKEYANAGKSRSDDWSKPLPWLQRLRANWFHMSAHYVTIKLLHAVQPVFRTPSGDLGTGWTHRQHGVRSRRIFDG